MTIPSDPEALLRRDAAAAALTAAGYPIAKASLAWYATMGGGPMFQRFGRYPLYKWGDALSWARDRLTRPVRSTSELDRPAA
jgi:hypothetical protein